MPVTVTGVEVSPDLSHAKVSFTHLAGREHADETVHGAGAHRPASCAPRCRSRLDLYSVPQLHFEYDDSIERGHAPVAADRRRRGRRQEARRVSRVPRRRPAACRRARRPASCAVPSTACCCSTSRSGISSNAALQHARRLYRAAEGRAHRHARSARLGPAAAVLRRGDQVRADLLDARQALRGHDHASARRRRPATRRARCSATRPVTFPPRGARARRCRAFTATLMQMPPVYSALKFEGRPLLRVRAGRAGGAARAARGRDPRAATRVVAGRTPWSTSSAAREPTCACWREDIGRGARLRRAPRRAAAHGHRRLSPGPRGHARRARGPGRGGARRPAAAGRGAGWQPAAGGRCRAGCRALPAGAAGGGGRRARRARVRSSPAATPGRGEVGGRGSPIRAGWCAAALIAGARVTCWKAGFRLII